MFVETHHYMSRNERYLKAKIFYSRRMAFEAGLFGLFGLMAPTFTENVKYIKEISSNEALEGDVYMIGQDFNRVIKNQIEVSDGKAK